MFNTKKVMALLAVLFLMALVSGCGGGNSATDPTAPPVSQNATIIPESVKVEKAGDSVTINYQTSSAIAKSSVVTTNFAFNNAPLWENFNEASSKDGVNHTVTLKAPAAGTTFMIYNSPSDKYDNGGKGVKIQ